MPNGNSEATNGEHNEPEVAGRLDVLAEFEKTYRRFGAVGEERNAKIIYLGLTSRVLDRPVSIAVKGPSSGGKSFTVQTVLNFFPDSAYHALTAMSDRNLAYTDLELRHRFLILYEAAGLTGEMGSYLLRSLLSEGRIAYSVTEQTPQGFRPRHIVKEGPTGLIVTTTRVRLHPENETRLLSLTVADTQAQTRAVLLNLASRATVKPDMKPWLDLQDWLSAGEHRVNIPYAEPLAHLIPPIAVRLRRDFACLLNLIRAHAILHRATRGRDAEGQILATLADYHAVRSLLCEPFSEGAGTSISTEVRETVEAVRELGGTERSAVTYQQLMKRLLLDKSSVSRRVADAISAGYLMNLEDKKGKRARIVLADPIPANDEDILPPVEALQDYMQRRAA